MPRAVIYCRVSTKEQTQNLSLPVQEQSCRTYCDREDLEVARVFVEEGESAKTTDRPDLQAMLASCRKHPGWVQFLVVYSVDRLARDQFFELGLHRTSARTGVMLFVSPHDRYVEVIADAGVPGPLPDAAWRPCVDAVRAGAREQRLADGLERALELLGAELRERLPGVGRDRNELPDRPVVL